MKEAVEFAERAERYRAFIEGAAKLELRERVRTARVLVLELYRSGLELGDGGSGDSVPNPSQPVDWPGFDRFECYFHKLELFDVERGDGAGLLFERPLDIYFDAVARSGIGASASTTTGATPPSARFRRSISRKSRGLNGFHVKHLRARLRFSRDR